MNRIVPGPSGYEVWSGSVRVCTCVSKAAAREELNYLNALAVETLEIDTDERGAHCVRRTQFDALSVEFMRDADAQDERNRVDEIEYQALRT